MGISPQTVEYLRRSGHEVRHLRELGLSRLPDSEILAKARSEACILLTHDLDFGELLAACGAELPSVVIFRLRDMRPGSLNQALDTILERHQKELRSGVIMSVSEGQVRMRSLPLFPAKE
jgi:predicted nuclease of predicted toxin-antitoxin system